ncbi:hypothetical protein [Methylobacterium aquaticum]|uniref:Uncharacterized protein n=1 Tax=Methylobacterium aquaticum TaxID=270351 RepID=A0A0J6SHK6_9HYPH|nr:hypothetical protein [Methylobacterium aquaticum]KMO34705.1 hypothetical protein VP06_13635 [Methylobacterium aquaticum]
MADRPWPPSLRFASILFEPVSTSRSGGQSFTGAEQVIVSPTARWKASVTIPIADRRYGPIERQNMVLAYRWVKAGGRASVIIVPHQDGRGPAHQAGIVPCSGAVPHSDGATFSDGSGYAQSFTGATLAAPAALNATQISLNVPAGLAPLPGMRFSTPDNRLHQIDDLLGFDGGSTWTVRIGPWLRAVYPVGTVMDFDNPRCRMRLASDDTGQLSLSLNKFGTPSIEFNEAP